MKLWKKVLAAVTAGVLCVGSAGLSGVQQIALAAYAETTSVLAAEDSADSDTLELGIESKSITIEELEDENYEVTLDITSSREFNGLGVGVRLSEGMEFVENGLKSSLDRAGELQTMILHSCLFFTHQFPLKQFRQGNLPLLL